MCILESSMIMIRRSYLVGALLALVAFTPLAAQNGESPSRSQGLSTQALDSLLTQDASLTPELEQRLQTAPSLGQLLLNYYRQGGLPPTNYYSPLVAQLLLPRPWTSVSRTPLGLSSQPQPSAALSILAPTEEQLTHLTSSPRPFDLTSPQLSPGYGLGLALRRDYLRQLELRHPEYFASSSPAPTLALARPSDSTSERLLESYTKESKLKKIDLPQQRNYGDLQERHWLPGLESSIQFSQNQVSENWYKGGASNLNVYMRNYFSLRYITERVLWNNELESKLSIYNAEKDSVHRYRIADDLLRLRSNYGLRAWNKVYYTLDAELRTQLLQSHRENRESVQSDFLAPFTIGALTAKRSPCHSLGFRLCQYRLYVLLLRQNIALQLVNHGFHVYKMSEIKETPSLEIRNANGSHLTLAISFLHSAPSAKYVTIGLVN